MKTNRRRFLQNSCTAALTAALLSPATAAFGQSRVAKPGAPPAASADPLARLTRQDFVPYIGEVMPVSDSSARSAAFQLIEANDLKNDANERRGYVGEVYSLIFEGSGKRISGGLYEFDHYALGRFSLMIVPVGMSGKRFEAIVNRTGRLTDQPVK